MQPRRPLFQFNNKCWVLYDIGLIFLLHFIYFFFFKYSSTEYRFSATADCSCGCCCCLPYRCINLWKIRLSAACKSLSFNYVNWHNRKWSILKRFSHISSLITAELLNVVVALDDDDDIVVVVIIVVGFIIFLLNLFSVVVFVQIFFFCCCCCCTNNIHSGHASRSNQRAPVLTVTALAASCRGFLHRHRGATGPEHGTAQLTSQNRKTTKPQVLGMEIRAGQEYVRR